MRSLLSNSEGHVTVIFKSDHPIEYMSYCWTAIRRVLTSAAADNIRGMQVGGVGCIGGCVFGLLIDWVVWLICDGRCPSGRLSSIMCYGDFTKTAELVSLTTKNASSCS